jgi:hypothetical protein
MVYQNSKKLTIVILAMIALLGSCKTKPETEKQPAVPKVPKAEDFYAGRNDFALMAEGASFYVHAQVQSVRPILNALRLGNMTGVELKDFLDMSEVLTAAVFSSEEWHFYAAAMGDFPSTRGGLFFNASKDWETKVSTAKIPYWHSPRSRLSVSLNAKQAYISDDDPFVPPPGAKVPDALPALKKDSALCGWINDPSAGLNRFVASFGIPVKIPANRIVFAVYAVQTDKAKESSKSKAKEAQQYTATLRFETSNANQANALVSIFSLARLGLASADFSKHKDMETLVRAFFWQSPRAEGSALILDTGTMRGEDIALLFNLISLY